MGAAKKNKRKDGDERDEAGLGLGKLSKVPGWLGKG